MLLTDALQELSTGLDVVYATTQGRLLTRLAQQLTRLSQCEQSLRFGVLQQQQQRKELHTQHAALQSDHAELQVRAKKMQARMQRQKQEQEEEKEWIASLWPDDAVLPTLLQSYRPDSASVRFVSQIDAHDERKRLQALVNRRAAKERVLQQVEIAAQWKMMFVAPTTGADGEYVAGQAFYQNTVTGESAWEAPVAMFYEPPTGWDHAKMDWKDSHGLHHFYPQAEDDLTVEEDDDKRNNGDVSQEKMLASTDAQISAERVLRKPQKATTTMRVKIAQADDDDSGDSSDSDDDANGGSESDVEGRGGESDEEIPDPTVLRDELTREFANTERIQQELTKSKAQQRAIALQLLNASRESYEREQEALAQDDEEKMDVERKIRKAKMQEEAAAKATAEALERKASKSVQPKFARDSVGKKDMTLSKDDELFEKELRAYVVEQRADRLYLASPLAKDERAKFHHLPDEEFVHMKHIEKQVLEIEQCEFDLLEKSASRHEEAASRSDALVELLEQARVGLAEVEAELARLPQQIALLEITQPPPTEPRPSEEELEQARARYLIPDDTAADAQGAGGEAVDDDDDGGDGTKRERSVKETTQAGHSREEDEGEGDNGDGAGSDEVEQDEDDEADPDEDVKSSPQVPGAGTSESARLHHVDSAAVLLDEAELKRLKRFVDADKLWKHWELEEVLRLEDLAAAYDRFQALETMKRRLVVDLALYEADLQFFSRLRECEKELNEKMWSLQASSQVERARFLVERAAREESVFQVQDEYEAVCSRLEEAKRLPRQARNPLETVELLEKSRVKAQQLQEQLSVLQARCEKEHEAKALLMALETRFCEYALAKMHEESKLFTEKQTLWDLNRQLQDDMQQDRATIERLYLVLRNGTPVSTSAIGSDKTGEASDKPAAAQYEDAVAVFDEKLRRLEAARQFLLLCYDREARWRSLASISLIKDTTSDAWMTAMQRERQDQLLATLQAQHDAERLTLQREIKLLNKVKALLQSQVQERDAKIERLRHEYQRSSDAVRVETEQIVLGLKEHLEQEELARSKERDRAVLDRERLIQEHELVTAELEQRVAEQEAANEQQWHWLTAARRELHAQRVGNEELLMGYQSLEKRRASETNDMRFRIGAQIAKINSIEMWNLSLKIQAREAHSERINMQREVQRLIQHHKQQQRLLRLENWRHRVTAQAILTDVHHLFAFFAHGLEILAGATPSTNAALRDNGGIEVLAALAQHSGQDAIRVIAARALGEIAWNANVTPRALGWRAKRTWFRWQHEQSTRVQRTLRAQRLEFDSAAPEDSTEMNWLADTGAVGGVGETDAELHDPRATGGKKIAFLRAWNARDYIERPDVNAVNQEYIGLAPRVLQTIVDLCKPPQSLTPGEDAVTATRIQRNALRSLAIVVMNTRNTAIVGRLDGCIPLLVDLLRPPHARSDTTDVRDVHVLSHAMQALDNLAFQNAHNQTQICAAGAVPLLLGFCAVHTDVDVLRASVDALATLSRDHMRICEALFDAGALRVLTRLCHSYRIHDAVDLDVFESIQRGAAECIANVITMLDADQEPQDPQQQELLSGPTPERDVARAILDATDDEERDEDEHGAPGHRKTARAGLPASAHPGVATFVLMSASSTRDVAFHGALVLGSIAQHDEIRAAIGNAGGIDALFLLTERHVDPPLVAQAAWALANVTWNRDNQYRVARYFDALHRVCTFRVDAANVNRRCGYSNQADDIHGDHDDDVMQYCAQIREHGLCVLANALFYNDANRQLVASETKWMSLLQHQTRHARGAQLEHAARAFCSLSYSDAVALAMGMGGAADVSRGHSAATAGALAPAAAVHGLEIFVCLCTHAESALVQKHGLFGIINMCLHDANKARLLAVPGGVETLVNLSAHTNRELSDAALEALDLLADVRVVQERALGSSGATVLSPSTMSSLAASDLKKLIGMLHDEAATPALVAMASDAIADEVWKKPSAKVRLRNEHGLDKLLELCVSPESPIIAPTGGGGHGLALSSPQAEHHVLLSCLWALRNSIADNARNQDYVGALDGVAQLVQLYDRNRRQHDVVEAVLAVLVALVMKHPRNSQELVQSGLDMLIALADGTVVSDEHDDATEEELRQHHGVAHDGNRAVGRKKQASLTTATTLTTTTKANALLARELLHLVAPYNSTVLPPIAQSTGGHAASMSPDKTRVMKKATAAPMQLPVLGAGVSPLSMPVSPSKRQQANN